MNTSDIPLVFANDRLTHKTLNQLAEAGFYYCSRCKQVQPLSEFMAKAQSKNGVRSPCKTCWKAYESARNKTDHRKELFANRYCPKETIKRSRNQDPRVIRGIYVLRMGDIYKIGCSTNIHKRICDLKASLPFKSELIHVISVQGPLKAAELQLHTRFKHLRSNGEWFTLSPNDIAEIKKVGDVSP